MYFIFSLLARLLSALPPTELMSCHEMKMGLTHPDSHVYSLTLDCIQRGCVDPDAAMILARRPDMLKLLVSGEIHLIRFLLKELICILQSSERSGVP